MTQVFLDLPLTIDCIAPDKGVLDRHLNMHCKYAIHGGVPQKYLTPEDPAGGVPVLADLTAYRLVPCAESNMYRKANNKGHVDIKM